MNNTAKRNFWLFTLIALTVFACRKDIANVFDGDGKQEAIQWVRDYYQKSLQQERSLVMHLPAHEKISGIPEKGLEVNKKTVQWENASSGATRFYDFVETDLAYDQRIYHSVGLTHDPNAIPVFNKELAEASFDRLVIYKNKQGKINQRIISYIPDNEYLKRHKENISHNRIDKLDKDFFGYIQYRAWDGGLLFELRIEKGIAVKRYAGFINNNSNALAQKTMSKPASKERLMVVDPGDGGGGGTGEQCYHISWDVSQVCYYADEHAVFPYYCDPVVVSNVEYVPVPCPPDQEGPGGPGPDPEEPPCLGVLNFETGECILEADCAGVPGGTAYMASCGCIGGTTGIDSCSKKPCDEVKIINKRLLDPFLKAEDSVLATKPIGDEYGTEDRLAHIPGNLYMVPNIRTTGTHTFQPVFTWDATNGYTIGFNHKHTGNFAPSPNDVGYILARDSEPDLVNSGSLQYFKDNAYTRTQTSVATYVTTINDWAAAKAIFANPNRDLIYSNYMTDYLAAHLNASDAEKSEYALMKMFGSTINFYKYSSSSHKFKPMKLDNAGYSEIISCL